MFHIAFGHAFSLISDSVSLVIINLLAETPHDVTYYWRSVSSPISFIRWLNWMFRMRAWIDMALMLLTFFGTIIWNVEVGVLVSLVISLLLVVHRSSKTRMMILVSHCIGFTSCKISRCNCRVAFREQIVGNRSVKIPKPRKILPELSSSGFGRTWISVRSSSQTQFIV